jgi:hopanoid C-3 methylase
MKILLVRPRQSEETIGLQHVMIVEPLELEVIAATVAPGDDVKIVDMILEKKDIYHQIRSYGPNVVGVTGYITNIPQMIEYSRAAKEVDPDIKTVVGGVYVEKFPEEANHASIDYRVVRNATRTFPALMEHLKGKGPKPAGALALNEKHDPAALPAYDFYYPMPRRDLTGHYHKKYFYVYHDRVALMKTSFGCPYKCDFCYCRMITDDNYHARPISEVLDELETIKQREVYIVDDDFLVSRKRMTEFMAGLRERSINKKYLVYGRADFIAKNEDIIRDFKKLGLRTVIVGLESFSDDELNTFNKLTSSTTNEQCMRVLNKIGVDCYAACICSPDWDAERFNVMAEKLIELGVKFVNLQPLTPLPGTGIKVREEDLVIDRKDYPKWDLAHVAIRPEKMGLDEYYWNIINLYKKVTFCFKHVITHMKYPIRMQIRVLGGASHVHKQYVRKYKEAVKSADALMEKKQRERSAAVEARVS